MKRLAGAARREPMTRQESLHETLKWLARAGRQADDSISYGDSL
jgi:hypothetical protein